jgi:tRNA (guanosine-2'-O-)-methyltransferase
MTEEDKKEPHPLEKFFLQSRLDRIDEVLAHRSFSTVVVLDGVQNEHNISAVLRSADAFGLQKIYLVGSEFSHSKGVSLGSEGWLHLKRFSAPEEALAELTNEGYEVTILQAKLISEKQGQKATPVQDLPFERKLALVFGNEKRGVSHPFQQAAQHFAFIPMVGFVESLNISVAAALTFYSAFLAKRPVIKDNARASLRHEWLTKDLRGGEEILKRVLSERTDL